MKRKKKVLITGILGQDGANMAEHLLLEHKEDYKVYGMMRRSANPNFKNTHKFKNHPSFEFVIGDLTDQNSLDKIVESIEPDYFINFAANSFVGVSWDMPLHVMDTNASGVIRCLEAIRKFKKECKFYSAGSSEEWGDVDYSPQDIEHKIKPRSPYGASKAAARHIVKVYRESYGMYAVHGILFNHEGTKRGEEFVTRKITKNVARIKKQLSDPELKITPMELGNLDAKRDWSDSEDFVRGVWLMLNQEDSERRDEFNKAFENLWENYKNHGVALGGADIEGIARESAIPLIKDYILSSGETHSIREFVEKAFAYAEINGEWKGEDLEEKFVTKVKRKEVTLVKINPKFFRPAEVELLLGDCTPIKKELGWKPKISFDKLVRRMVEFDLNEQASNSQVYCK